MKNGFGLRMPVYGVFEHQDVVGLETCKAVMDYVVGSLNSSPTTPESLGRDWPRGEVSTNRVSSITAQPGHAATPSSAG